MFSVCSQCILSALLDIEHTSLIYDYFWCVNENFNAELEPLDINDQKHFTPLEIKIEFKFLTLGYLNTTCIMLNTLITV